MSIFRKYFIPLRLFRVSVVSGSGYLSFTVILFRARKSIYRRSPPLGFFINRIGEVQGEELRQINPFLRFSLSYSFKAYNSFQDIVQSGPKGGSYPPINLISQSYEQYGSSLSTSFGEKIDINREKQSGNFLVRSSLSSTENKSTRSSIVVIQIL